ncbi:hypothetical protein AAG570_004985 [Ranatra chinensis]|uniref:Uncharacterized protein n=1 Tax=Ranatra chinensis TaxID=642074 RepID=A0ABD0XZF4_9HEMI
MASKHRNMFYQNKNRETAKIRTFRQTPRQSSPPAASQFWMPFRRLAASHGFAQFSATPVFPVRARALLLSRFFPDDGFHWCSRYGVISTDGVEEAPHWRHFPIFSLRGGFEGAIFKFATLRGFSHGQNAGVITDGGPRRVVSKTVPSTVLIIPELNLKLGSVDAALNVSRIGNSLLHPDSLVVVSGVHRLSGYIYRGLSSHALSSLVRTGDGDVNYNPDRSAEDGE